MYFPMLLWPCLLRSQCTAHTPVYVQDTWLLHWLEVAADSVHKHFLFQNGTCRSYVCADHISDIHFVDDNMLLPHVCHYRISGNVGDAVEVLPPKEAFS